MKKLNFLAVTIVSLFGLSSCSNDDNGPVNEEEVITTVITTLSGGGQVATLTSRDLDGDGPNPPVITVSGDLTANTTYLGETSILNELEDPAEDITVEVEEEGTDHQLFYQIPTSLGAINYTDLDSNGKPIGVTFSFTTAEATSGNITVTLRHLPNKAGVGVSSGDITNAGGATDFSVTYPLIVQ